MIPNINDKNIWSNHWDALYCQLQTNCHEGSPERGWAIERNRTARRDAGVEVKNIRSVLLIERTGEKVLLCFGEFFILQDQDCVCLLSIRALSYNEWHLCSHSLYVLCVCPLTMTLLFQNFDYFSKGLGNFIIHNTTDSIVTGDLKICSTRPERGVNLSIGQWSKTKDI